MMQMYSTSLKSAAFLLSAAFLMLRSMISYIIMGSRSGTHCKTGCRFDEPVNIADEKDNKRHRPLGSAHLGRRPSLLA